MVKTSKNQHVPRSCRFESSLDSITCSHFKTITILLGCGDSVETLWRCSPNLHHCKEGRPGPRQEGKFECQMLDSATIKFSLSATTGKGCRALAGVAREGATFLYEAIIPIKGDSSVTRPLGSWWNPQQLPWCTRPQEVLKQEQQKVLEQARPKATSDSPGPT